MPWSNHACAFALRVPALNVSVPRFVVEHRRLAHRGLGGDRLERRGFRLRENERAQHRRRTAGLRRADRSAVEQRIERVVRAAGRRGHGGNGAGPGDDQRNPDGCSHRFAPFVSGKTLSPSAGPCKIAFLCILRGRAGQRPGREAEPDRGGARGRRFDPHRHDRRPRQGPRSAFAIVDAHQHFWDPDAQLLPVAQRRAARSRFATATTARSAAATCRPTTAPTRRRSSSRRPSTSRPNGIRAIRSARRATSQRCAASTACRRSLVGAGVARRRRRAAACSSSRPRSTSCAACGTSRARIASPDDAAPGGTTDAKWRAGYAQLARNGLRFDLQTPWWHLAEAARLAADFPDTHDHPQSHRAAVGPQRRGHRRLEARDGHARRLPERRT